MNRDRLIFAPERVAEEDRTLSEGSFAPWKVLIVDDEEQVHTVTTLVLGDFSFDGRAVKFYHAYSAAEARALLSRHHDFALAIIDVVMESDQAGLKLLHYVRRSLGNDLTRLVLRTGQPGEAPEESIIFEYDLNDYKDKSELTATRLKTLLLTALRSYRDIISLDRGRRSIKALLTVSSELFRVDELQHFTHIVLSQMLEILHSVEPQRRAPEASGLAAVETPRGTVVLATLGHFSALPRNTSVELPETVTRLLTDGEDDGQLVYGRGSLGFVACTRFGQRHWFFLERCGEIAGDTRQLMELYRQNVCTALDTAYALENLRQTQEQLVHTLSQAIETRSTRQMAGGSLLASLCELLAREAGFSVEESRSIGLAARLHDIGVMCIPDQLLLKPGPHSPDEQRRMQQHVAEGMRLIGNPDQQVLAYARRIIQTHHEKWDGSGYPAGLAGEDIDILGRITAIADVFDALLSQRTHRERWSHEQAIQHIMEGAGKEFDPTLVDIFKNRIDDILALIPET